MTDQVKARRAYRSARRQAGAAQTRRAVIEAAGTQFRRHGYRVALSAIAREAGVAVETIYRIFGTKTGLFRAVIDALLAGGTARADLPVEQRPAIRAIRDEPDPRRKVARYAATQPGIHRRAGPLLRALRDAKSTDPELSRLWSELEASRFEGQGRFVRALAEQGALRPDRSADEGSDILWVLSSLAVYDLLVVERGWTDAAYESWLAGVLGGELVRQDPVATPLGGGDVRLRDP